MDLFSGIGGFSLGLERVGMKTVAFCEIEKFPQAVLRKHWPGVPIYDDILTLTADRLRSDGIGAIDVICGGFPCQPFSVAGRRAGKEDHRDLWPEMFRIIQECQPTWVIGENVTGFVGMAFERTAADLESEGYEVQAIIIPACAIGAPHRRDRVWIIAYSNKNESTGLPRRKATKCPIAGSSCEYVSTDSDRERCRQGGDNWEERHVPDEQIGSAKENQSERHRREFGAGADGTISTHPKSAGLEGKNRSEPKNCEFTRLCEWQTVAPVCGGDNGLSRGLDKHRAARIKALGNAVVPQITEIIGRSIMEKIAP